MEIYIILFDLLGTIAFSVSGALVAIKKEMDLLGVVILGTVTAVGGGVIRDIILGITPPSAFRNPRNIIIAIITALIMFIIVWVNHKRELVKRKTYNLILFLSDTIGLGVFTVIGIETAIENGIESSNNLSVILLLFVGIITGVGGGVLRDILAGNIPYIFIKHIYASACIGGSIVCLLMWNIIGKQFAMLLGSFAVIIVRILASRFKWNLPKISEKN